MADPQSRAGTGYSSPEIRAFVEQLYSPPQSDLADALAQLERFEMPRIQVSPTDGKILQVLLALVGARRVVEFGTLSGYSALWMLRALGPEGHLWTCELEPRHAAAARAVFDRAGYGAQVTILEGAGQSLLGELATFAPFDAVFLDADKAGYAAYARWAFEHLRPGGLILADNTYLFGYLSGREPEGWISHETIAAMQDFHRFVAEHCLAVTLPTPDGLTVGIKPA